MLIEKTTIDDIAFIIVLYKQELVESITFKALNNFKIAKNQKVNLIVYDNTSQKQNYNSTTNVLIAAVINDFENPGVSKAYNAGVKIARQMGYKWVVLLDQDTDFSSNFINRMIVAINQHLHIKLFAPIIKLKNGSSFSPSRYKHKRGYLVELNEGMYSLEKYSPVNSGLVINIGAFYIAGGYNENVKLDFSDFQFIERFRKCYKDFYVFNSIAIQDFSNNEVDLKKLETRFGVYCVCAKNCSRESFTDNLAYLYSVFRHTTALALKTKKISFFKIFYYNYLKLKKSNTYK